MPFELPKLNFNYSALEPHIDAKTMEIHHTKHHQTYITNLNNALSSHSDLADKSILELITSLETLPEELKTPVRNNGGGHYNHSLFWEMLSPQTKKIPDTLSEALSQSFGSIETFKDEFKKAALSRFGSGWAWLVRQGTELKILSTANQDNPLMEDADLSILLGLDVWEHAYYLNYQNRRADYIDAFWSIIDWDYVEGRLA
jgi:Fe-Mn family superoxide dismutase